MSKLSKILDGKAAPATEQQLSKLGAALASGTIALGVEKEIAPFGRVFVSLIGMREAQRIEGECVAACERLGIPQDSIAHATAFEAEKAIRWLAIALRDPDDHSKPLGTLEEWERVDVDTVTRAWLTYGDVRDQMQPEVIEITAPMRVTITAAIAQKKSALLQSFGTHVLVSYLLSTDEQPPTSPT